MDILTIVLTSIGVLVALFPLGFVAYLNGGGLYHQLKRSSIKKMAGSPADALNCSLDADCPPGHVCVNGVCLPQGS